MGFVLGYFKALVLIMKAFVKGIVHSFENDNSKRCMSCCCIGMGLVIYGNVTYVCIMILEDVGHGNIIHCCYYNNNRSSESRFMIRISNGKGIELKYSYLVYA